MQENNKRECISFLRIVSITMVVLIHSSIYIPWSDSLKKIIAQGQMGLWIFMVLSGYLISASFEKDEKNIWLYYKKRIVRIVPLYWSYLIILIIVGKASGWFEFSAWDWIRQFIFCDLIIPSGRWDGMWALGSLSSFFFFYLTGPVLIKQINSVDKGMIAVMIGIVSRLVCPMLIAKVLTLPSIVGIQSDVESFAYNTPLATIVFFIVGILIYRVEQAGESMQIGKLLLALILTWMAALVISDNSMRVVAYSGLMVSMVVLFPIKLPKCICRFNKVASPYTFPLYICHFSVFDFINNIFGGG